MKLAIACILSVPLMTWATTAHVAADPFRVESGPTAWMPPALPAALTAFLWLAADDEKTVTNVVVTFQSVALVGTGWLVLAAARAAFPRARLWPACGRYPPGRARRRTRSACARGR